MRILMIGDTEKTTGESQGLFTDLSAGGFKVVRISDPEEGLEMLKTNRFDCLILDRDTSKKEGGMDIVDFNKESGMGLPILMISSDSSAQDLVDMFERGIDDYVRVPFDNAEIVARVNSLINTKCHKPLLTCGRLILDPIGRDCLIEGTSIPLRRREFDILELLMRNENQVFSRERIITEIWKKEYDGTSNIVDVHIKYLRDKLRREKMNSIVITVRGIGYKVQCSDFN